MDWKLTCPFQMRNYLKRKYLWLFHASFTHSPVKLVVPNKLIKNSAFPHAPNGNLHVLETRLALSTHCSFLIVHVSSSVQLRFVVATRDIVWHSVANKIPRIVTQELMIFWRVHFSRIMIIRVYGFSLSRCDWFNRTPVRMGSFFPLQCESSFGLDRFIILMIFAQNKRLMQW